MRSSSAQFRLSQALVNDRPSEARTALVDGASVQRQDWAGTHALHRCRSLEMLTVLLASGADPSQADHSGRLPLEAAVATGYRAVAWRLFQATDIPMSRRGLVLRLACRYPFARLVQALLALGVSADAPDGQGRSPLLCLLQSPLALSAEAERVVGVLLSAGASWEVTARNGLTPRQVLDYRIRCARYQRWSWAVREALLRMGGYRIASRHARLERLASLAFQEKESLGSVVSNQVSCP